MKQTSHNSYPRQKTCFAVEVDKNLITTLVYQAVTSPSFLDIPQLSSPPQKALPEQVKTTLNLKTLTTPTLKHHLKLHQCSCTVSAPRI